MRKNTILQKCWVWNESVTNFVKDRIKGKSLNVCAGKNPICSVNIDLDPQDKSILKGDMRLLPFRSNSFDTVVSDPPWKIGYYERFKPFFECVRVCKVGGRVIYNATWIPSCPSGDVKLLDVYVRQDNDFSNTSIISVFEKIQDNPEYNQKQESLLSESPTSQTKSLRDFPNGEHNKDLTATQQVASPKSASQTSLNPDIKRNKFNALKFTQFLKENQNGK